MATSEDFYNPDDFALKHALEVIKGDYGKICYYKPKTLLKFGRNEGVGTAYEDVWQYGGAETLPTGNTIDTVSSSSTSDTTTMVVEGFVITAGNKIFTVQTVTLTGQTKALLTTPLARCTRAYASGVADLVGDVYVYEDDTLSAGVPTTAALVHMVVKGTLGENQSFKAATSVSSDDYWVITQIYVAVLRKAAAQANFELQVKEDGKVWRSRNILSSSSSSAPNAISLSPPIIIPSNSDVRVRVQASTAGVDCVAWVNGYLALVDRDA
jgi:hypothetical protein